MKSSRELELEIMATPVMLGCISRWQGNLGSGSSRLKRQNRIDLGSAMAVPSKRRMRASGGVWVWFDRSEMESNGDWLVGAGVDTGLVDAAMNGGSGSEREEGVEPIIAEHKNQLILFRTHNQMELCQYILHQYWPSVGSLMTVF